MSRRLGLRLVPDRVVDEREDPPSAAEELSLEQLDQIARRAARDEREIRDPKIRAAIRKGYAEFLAGKTRPIQEFFVERRARARKRSRQ